MSDPVGLRTAIEATGVPMAVRLFEKLVGPSVSELGEWGGDVVHQYRTRNLAARIARTAEILEEKGLRPQSVHPRTLLPLFEAASLEEDETLGEMWAQLLATATQDGGDTPMWVAIMRQLSPADATLLQTPRGVDMPISYEPGKPGQAVILLPPDRPLDQSSMLAAANLERLALVRTTNSEPWITAPPFGFAPFRVERTWLGNAFIAASTDQSDDGPTSASEEQ